MLTEERAGPPNSTALLTNPPEVPGCANSTTSFNPCHGRKTPEENCVKQLAALVIVGLAVAACGNSTLFAGSPDWCEENDLSPSSCADLKTIVEGFGQETTGATFSDGSPFPPGLLDTIEVCNARHPFDDAAYGECLLLNSDPTPQAPRSVAPRATSPTPSVRDSVSTTPITPSSAKTTEPTTTTTLLLFPSDPNEPKPPTTNPLFLQSGLGVVSIGDPTATALELLTTIHGTPTEDTGWGPGFSEFGTCPAEEARQVKWGSLEAIFVRPIEMEVFGPWTFANGPQGALFSISEQLGSTPEWGYPTLYGIRIGDSVSRLLDVYGDRVEISEAEGFGYTFFVIDPPPDGTFLGLIWGIVSGFDLDDRVTSLHTGPECGE